MTAKLCLSLQVQHLFQTLSLRAAGAGRGADTQKPGSLVPARPRHSHRAARPELGIHCPKNLRAQMLSGRQPEEGGMRDKTSEGPATSWLNLPASAAPRSVHLSVHRSTKQASRRPRLHRCSGKDEVFSEGCLVLCTESLRRWGPNPPRDHAHQGRGGEESGL